MKILLVRHGETNYNKNKLIQGHSDIELNETGRNQATSAGEKLSDHNIEDLCLITLIIVKMFLKK